MNRSTGDFMRPERLSEAGTHANGNGIPWMRSERFALRWIYDDDQRRFWFMLSAINATLVHGRNRTRQFIRRRTDWHRKGHARPDAEDYRDRKVDEQIQGDLSRVRDHG